MASRSNRINENAVRNRFMAYARGAAAAERRAEYDVAADLWRKACNMPCHRVNAEHALLRADFCTNAAQKRWGLKDECKTV